MLHFIPITLFLIVGIFNIILTFRFLNIKKLELAVLFFIIGILFFFQINIIQIQDNQQTIIEMLINSSETL